MIPHERYGRIAGVQVGRQHGTGGPTRIVLQFTEAVTLSGSNVDLSSGTCVGVTSLGNHAYQVELSGADENACLTLTLVNVAGVSSGRRLVGINQVRVVVLKGDVNASGAVNIFDLTAIRGQNQQPAAIGNFRCDVNADGVVDTQDMILASTNTNASAACTLPEVPLHWQYSWDAENRLVAVAPAVPAAGDKKVVFTYDYMSRRVQKRVFAWDATLNGGAGDWEANPEVYHRFVYDQWNVVLVLDGPNRTITHKYTWGLDLSGLAGQGAAGFSPRGPSDGATAGIHNAGGIGGLLAVEAPQAVGDPLRHWYFYDGNGNVGQLLAYDATGPTVNAAPAAHYEYDPYGQLIATTGGYAIANPFRFSTKWFDTTTGLGYWGYRYYSPRLGRWMSRDPIEELGGQNLYAYMSNHSLSTIDPWGLAEDCRLPGCGVSQSSPPPNVSPPPPRDDDQIRCKPRLCWDEYEKCMKKAHENHGKCRLKAVAGCITICCLRIYPPPRIDPYGCRNVTCMMICETAAMAACATAFVIDERNCATEYQLCIGLAP